jgi:hypothetical protein
LNTETGFMWIHRERDMTGREKLSLAGGILAALAASVGMMILLLLPVIDALR